MSVRVTQLDNGLRIATDTMPDADSVVTGVWVAAGTRDEARNANGVAHLVEHMMFKGTKSRSSYALSNAIEKNGGSSNAYTTREETAYYARVLPEDTETAIDVISDMLQRSVLDPKELVREKQVVIQEIGRDLDTPEDYIFDRIYQEAFPGQRIGRSILGSVKVIDKMPRHALVNYIKTNYNTGSMIVVAAGRIEHDDFVKLVKKYFTKLPKGKMPRREAAQAKPGELLIEKDSEQLHFIMGFAGEGVKAKSNAATQVLATLLGGSSSSRLFQKIREKRGLVYTVSAMHGAMTDTGLFQIYAGTDPERIRELVPAVCREMIDVTKNISRGEVARAKAQIRAEVRMSRESVMTRADRLGHHMVVFGKPIPTSDTLKRYDAVTVEDAEEAARKLISKKPIIAALGPLAKLEDYSATVARLKV